jgi:hypothetical protein
MTCGHCNQEIKPNEVTFHLDLKCSDKAEKCSHGKTKRPVNERSCTCCGEYLIDNQFIALCGDCFRIDQSWQK